MRNPERIAAIRARFDRGETLQAIGDSYGLTRERVRQIVAKTGAEPRFVTFGKRRAEIAAAVKAENLSSDEAAARYGIGRGAVLAICSAFGVVCRQDFLWNSPEIAALADLVRGGMSIHMAAGHVHKVERLIWQYCQRNGIVSRYGRWHDRSPRVAMVQKMRAQGAGWEAIAAAVTELEGHHVGRAGLYMWVRNHLDKDVWKHVRPARKPRIYVPGPGKGRGPRRPAEQCDTIKEAARINYGKATAAEIAALHGVSRNVIIGHWFRLRRAGLLPPLQSEQAAA